MTDHKREIAELRLALTQIREWLKSGYDDSADMMESAGRYINLINGVLGDEDSVVMEFIIGVDDSVDISGECSIPTANESGQDRRDQSGSASA